MILACNFPKLTKTVCLLKFWSLLKGPMGPYCTRIAQFHLFLVRQLVSEGNSTAQTPKTTF